MSSSKSASSSSQTTATTDNRVGADNGAVVIQDSGQYNISFSPEVANATEVIIDKVFDFASDVVTHAGAVVGDSIDAQQETSKDFIKFGETSLASAPSTNANVAEGILNRNNFNTGIIVAGLLAGGYMFLKLRK